MHDHNNISVAGLCTLSSSLAPLEIASKTYESPLNLKFWADYTYKTVHLNENSRMHLFKSIC